MSYAAGCQGHSQYPVSGVQIGRCSSSFIGIPCSVIPQARRSRSRQSTTQAKQKPGADEPAAKAPPVFPGLFGGTKKIRSGSEPPLVFQAPAKGTQQLKKGTQQLKRGAQQQLGKGTQKLRLGGDGRGALPLPGTGTQPISLFSRGARKDPNTVFVAGATGRLGARVVRELLAASPQLRVRAGVRDSESAGKYLQTAIAYGLLPADAARRVQLVPVDITRPETLPSAIGNAGKVVQAIGAPESEPFNFSNPQKIDGDGSIALVQAAAAAGVDQFVMVTSLGTAKFGWPAAVLNLFGGILVQKRRAEVALLESGVNYVIVRPGGMERPSDTYKRTHNVTLGDQDTLFGGQVSRLQVAELIASIVTNPEIAENKVLEVVAETDAPRRPYENLLLQAPSDVAQADKLAQRQAAQQRQQQLDAALERLDEAKAASAEASDTVKEFAAVAGEARAQAAAAAKEAGPALTQAHSAQQQLERLQKAADAAQKQEAAARAVLAAATDAARQGRLLSGEERTAAEAPILFPERWAAEQEQQRAAAEQARQKQQREAEEQSKRQAAAKAAADANAKRDADAAKAKSRVVQAAMPAAAAVAKPAAAAVDLEELKKRRGADMKARRETEERVLRAAAEERQQREAQAKAKREAEAAARQAAEAKAKQEAQAKAKAQAEATAKTEEAEARAKREAKANAENDAKVRAQKEVEQKAAAQAKQEAERMVVSKAQKESDDKASKARANNEAAMSSVQAQAKNVEEARQWIKDWRTKGASSAAKQPASSSNNSPQAPFWPAFKLPWQQQAAASQNGSAADKVDAAEHSPQPSAKDASKDASENVLQAREWIRSWRARNLEKRLPTDVEARG